MAIRTNASAFALGTVMILGQGQVSTATSFDFIEAAVEEAVEATPMATTTEVAKKENLVTPAQAANESVPMPKGSHPTVVERYPNGKVKISRQVALDQDENFVSHGDYTVHAPDGTIQGGGQFHLGRKTGEWTRVFSTAVPVVTQNAIRGFTAPYTSVAIFKDDQLNGDWTITDGKKRPIVLWQFADGKREGQWLWFNPDGSTRKQIHFKRGQITDDIVASSGKDQVKVLVSYIDGRELTKHLSRFSPRQIKSEGFLLKPKEQTKVDVDWWDGILTEEVVGSTGEIARHGEWRFYHPNGKVQMEGTYDRGKETGRFVWYHENGQKSSEGDYYNGKKQGRWEGWYASGARKTAGVCVDGEHDGLWMSWHENGMPKLHAKYAKGTVVSSKSWDEKGKRTENVAIGKSNKVQVSNVQIPRAPVSFQ